MIWLAWTVGTVITYKLFIYLMQRRQLSQLIYEDSPDRHQAKGGTPTMGGIVLFLSFLIGMILLGQWTVSSAWIVASTALFWLIGAVDDGLSLKRGKNKGLSAKAKFTLQLLVSSVSIGCFFLFIQTIAWWQVPLYVLLITGASNATNLTDGLDGLLSSSMLVSLFGVWILIQSQWRYEESQMILLMMAAIAIFLFFNWHPARLFMGDVGSLMLGCFLATTIIATGEWLMLLGFGAIYVIETLSVMIQVAWYKRTKSRVFLMTPLHHHFELLGFSELSIVMLFAAIQSVFVWVQLL